jgi:hypothetical protein
MMLKKNNLILISLILLLIYFIQLKILTLFNFSPNFFLASLMVFVFFASNYLEILFLAFFSSFLINWKPHLNTEVILIFLIPQLIYFILKIFKLENWLTLLICLISANLLFYGVVNYHFFTNYLNYIIYDILISTLWGILVYLIFKEEKLL